MSNIVQQWSELTAGEFSWRYLALILNGVGSLYLIGLVFFFLERIRPAHPEIKFFKSDFRNEICYPLLNMMVSTPILTFLGVTITFYLLEPFLPHRPYESYMTSLPFVAQVLLALLLTDLTVYGEHRIAHRFLWDFHSLHHMTPEVTWLTHTRVHPVNAITIGVSALFTGYIVGFGGEAVVVAAWISRALAMWEHSNMDIRFPKPFCWLVVSPCFHRWHHASAPEAIDKNFCLIFPFVDLMFGTYYCPERMPTRYGVYQRSAGGEPAADAIPDNFVGQMLHPFRLIAQRTRARFLRPSTRLT